VCTTVGPKHTYWTSIVTSEVTEPCRVHSSHWFRATLTIVLVTVPHECTRGFIAWDLSRHVVGYLCW